MLLDLVRHHHLEPEPYLRETRGKESRPRLDAFPERTPLEGRIAGLRPHGGAAARLQKGVEIRAGELQRAGYWTIHDAVSIPAIRRAAPIDTMRHEPYRWGTMTARLPGMHAGHDVLHAMTLAAFLLATALLYTCSSR